VRCLNYAFQNILLCLFMGLLSCLNVGNKDLVKTSSLHHVLSKYLMDEFHELSFGGFYYREFF
jgi:hypothetical protein